MSLHKTLYHVISLETISIISHPFLKHFHHKNSIYKITTPSYEVKEEICRQSHATFSLRPNSSESEKAWSSYNLKKSEVGSAACFSGPQYTIPQLWYRSAQNAITQCFQICQCAMRNAAIADTSAMHNHGRGGEYEGAQGQSRILGLANQKSAAILLSRWKDASPLFCCCGEAV